MNIIEIIKKLLVFEDMVGEGTSVPESIEPGLYEDLFENDSHNPVNGLPMVGGVDVLGNPYGMDSGFDHDFGSPW